MFFVNWRHFRVFVVVGGGGVVGGEEGEFLNVAVACSFFLLVTMQVCNNLLPNMVNQYFSCRQYTHSTVTSQTKSKGLQEEEKKNIPAEGSHPSPQRKWPHLT